MAMGDSVGIRMAKSLGEGHATRAAFVARLGIIVSLIGGIVIAGQDDIRLPCHERSVCRFSAVINRASETDMMPEDNMS